MAVVDAVLSRVPQPYRNTLVKHREMVKFALVGGTCFLIDLVIWYALQLTVLTYKPTVAKAISVLIATIVSYILNREWSFRTRGGRERQHEAALFFVVSGIGLVLNTLPVYVAYNLLELREPYVSNVTEEISKFVAGAIIGTLIAMVFRYWAMKKYVFPDADARPGRNSHLTAVPDNESKA
ncbi:GtrA family protein [Pseudonocardiaceae bacterium YIM PH 21723]|nr:GtrA family protein [Pseudonocardiaceae bacterium YIM PH 21723]